MKINDVIISESPQCGDGFEIEIGDCLIESAIVGFTDDGIIVEADDKTLVLMHMHGAKFEHGIINEAFGPLPQGNKKIKIDGVEVQINRVGKDKNYIGFTWNSSNGKEQYEEVAVGNLGDYSDLVKVICDEIKYAERQIAKSADKSMSQVDEAKYQGREVPLGKPMQGDVAKFKVYVRGPKGNVVKVNFGDKTMRIKKSNPKRRKSFRARHRCSTPGPRWKARYWSCRKW